MASSSYHKMRRIIDPTGKIFNLTHWPRWVYYVISILALAIALSIKLYLNPLIGYTTPYLLMSAAIVVSALYGGLGPGLCTLILSVLAVNIFFFPPFDIFSINSQSFVPSSFFILEGLVIIVLGEERRQAVLERENYIGQEYLARTSAENAQKKSMFLTEASSLLATSFDNRTMLSSLARISVPFLSDWTIMDLKHPDGIFTRVAYAHKDPNKSKLLRFLEKNSSADLGLTQTIAKVIQTGKSERIAHTTTKFFAHTGDSVKSAQALHKVGLSQALVIPFKTRRSLLGAAVFAHSDNHRSFSADDIEFIEELAYRTALALENGLLYEGAQDEIAIRSQIEDELRRSRDQLQIILKGVAEGITVQDATGKLIFANDAAAKIVGIKTAAELIATPPERLMKDFEMFNERNEPFPASQLPGRLALEGKNPPEVILRYRYKSTQEERWSLVKATPVFARNNRVQLAINVFRDVTEQKIEEMRKDEFIGIASHELKSPLTVIKAFTQVLSKKFTQSKDAQTKEYLSRMDDQIKKLTDLINELLDVTRMRTGKLELHVAKTPIDQLLRTTVDNLSRTTTHQLFLRGTTRVSLMVDGARISQVLVNLVNNAVKYSPAANKVLIRADLEAERLIVSVTDFGIGITRQEQERIFSRFYQVRRVGQQANAGLGLGLYIAAQVIKAHGGYIWVESTRGKGSTFFFSLPVQSRVRKRQVSI